MLVKKRPSHMRKEEHMKNTKLDSKYHSVITKQHTIESRNAIIPYEIQWDNVKILHREKNYYKRSSAEMIFMKKEKNT